MESYIEKLTRETNYKKSGKFYTKEKDNYILTLIPDKKYFSVLVRSGLVDVDVPFSLGEKVAKIADRDQVQECFINNSSIQLNLNYGKLDAIEVEGFTDEIISIFQEYNIPGIRKCEICGEMFTGDMEVLVNVNSHFIKAHKSCSEKFQEHVEEEKGTRKKGSYLTGTLGALIFGLFGVIPWVIVSILGYFVSFIGLIIGIAANTGYDIFKGRQGKAKGFIILIITILMVVVAQFASELYSLFQYLNSEGIKDISLMDGLRYIVLLVQEEPEYRSSFLLNVGIGLVFAGLGVWRLIKASFIGAGGQENDVEVVD